MPTKLVVLFSSPRQPSVRSRPLEVTGRREEQLVNRPLVERGTREREKQRACSQAKERTGARETRKGRGIIGLGARNDFHWPLDRCSFSPRVSPSRIPLFLAPLTSKPASSPGLFPIFQGKNPGRESISRLSTNGFRQQKMKVDGLK